MFEKIGSKTVMLMVRHEDAKGMKNESLFRERKSISQAGRSLWFLYVYDFEDYKLERLKIEDLVKEKKGNNPDELSNDDEIDI